MTGDGTGCPIAQPSSSGQRAKSRDHMALASARGIHIGQSSDGKAFAPRGRIVTKQPLQGQERPTR